MDKQLYYKNLGTGMDQFGVHINSLQIKQVLIFIYALKINFFDYFLFFLVSRLGTNFWERRGSLEINRHPKGYPPIQAAGF
jgi:hypothetical protein